jgi:hypothetical protein
MALVEDGAIPDISQTSCWVDMDENIQLCRRACGGSGRSSDPKLGLEFKGYKPSMMYVFVKTLNSLMDMSRQLCGVVLQVVAQ